MVTAVEITRDYRLDLYRGLALWLIFLAHVPGSFLNKLTPWNYGFSDAAEIFVFVSGYANAYVYGRVMAQRGFWVSAAQVWRRAFEIYVAQMFLFVVFVGEIALLSHGTHAFDDEMNVRTFHEHPDESILAVLQLKFMPVNMDVLPVYIVLLAASPLVLWLLRRTPALALGAAGIVYLLANLAGLNLPSYPRGYWYFNPFAWQLVFVLGTWCGLGGAKWVWSAIRSNAVFAVSTIYLLLGVVIFIGVNRLGLNLYVPDWVASAFGKTNLGVLRLAHFLAMAIVFDRLIPPDWPLLGSRLLRPVIQCGQHSLEIFCLGVTLAFAGHVAIVGLSNSFLARIAVAVAGIGAMITMASLISWYNSTRVSFRVVDAVRRFGNQNSVKPLASRQLPSRSPDLAVPGGRG
jgi:hypothetical protein